MQHNYFDNWFEGLGGGMYFFYRLPDPFAVTALEKIVTYIYLNAETEGGDIKWANIRTLSHPVKTNHKEYNLSLSHGIPSIISFLSLAYKYGMPTDTCMYLLKDCINWLLKQKLQKQALSIFQTMFWKGIGYQKSRLAWCYGDLGIAVAIWNAGNAINNIIWKEEALKILAHTCNRKDWNKNFVYDASKEPQVLVCP